MNIKSNPVIQVLRDRAKFQETLSGSRSLSRIVIRLVIFIIPASAIYGAVLGGWRSPKLSLYVAIKLPVLLLGTTGLVAVFNWLLALVFRSDLKFRQVLAVTCGAICVTAWILLALLPVAALFTFTAPGTGGTTAELRLTHNCLLLIQIVLIAAAGVTGNAALFRGLKSIVSPVCSPRKLYWSWIGMFTLVGCQLSWILRPFIGSPFYPVVFMRPACLNRNFYEFILFEVIPNVLKGGG